MFNLFKFLRGNPQRDSGHRLYVALVEQARRPAFYAELGVPDSLDGRYEMIVLHAFLVMRRLKAAGEAGRDLSQTLFDVMFADLDQSLREMGVGDLGVGKRVKAMANGLYGRIAAYDQALAEGDEALRAAVARNVFGTTQAEPASVAALAAYISRQAELLAGQEDGALLQGQARFQGPAA